MTADGVPDLVAAVGAQGFLFFQGQSDGTLISSFVSGDPDAGSVATVAVADYDMDGLPDVCAITGAPRNHLKPLNNRSHRAPG